MRLAVTTVIDVREDVGRQSFYKNIAEDVFANKEAYCAVNNYTPRMFKESLDLTRPAAWSKIKAIQQCLEEGFDWVFWQDADCFVMNMNKRLEPLVEELGDRNFATSCDINSGVCTGTILIRNCDWSREFLNKVYAQEEFINHMWWEQAAVIHLLDNMDKQEYDNNVWIMPQDYTNSYPHPYNQQNVMFQPGHLAVHFPGNPAAKREARFDHYLNCTRFKLNDRGDFPIALKECGLLGEGVELGVQRAHYSNHLLETWPGKKLYSIDPWERQEHYRDIANVSDNEHELRYNESIQRLSKHGGRSEVIRDYSINAVKRFEDNSLDFVYLDARHAYEYVKEDIQLWLPKVKPGGILAGHDYVDGDIGGCDFGVKTAVHELLGEEHITSTTRDGPFLSWFYRKFSVFTGS